MWPYGTIVRLLYRLLAQCALAIHWSWGSVALTGVMFLASVVGVLPCTAGTWHRLTIGGGGFVTEVQTYADGTQIARTDTSGAWIRNFHTEKWSLLLNVNSMPAPDNEWGELQGVCSIAAAPTNTNYIYMYFAPNVGHSKDPSYVYVSTNKGATWTRTSFTSTNYCNANDSQSSISWRVKSPAMAVDPQNPRVVYLGTPSNGVWYSTDGGTTWAQISAIAIPTGTQPSGASQGQGNLIVFDPTDSTGASAYISAYGTGIFHCTGMATTPACTELNSMGMPTTQERMLVDQHGTLWIVDDSGGNLWRYSGGTWREVLTASGSFYVTCFAISPTNANYGFAIDPAGNAEYTINAQMLTPSWSSRLAFSETASIIKWMRWSADPFLNVGASCSFDPTQTNMLYVGSGVGIFTTSPPTSGSPTIEWNGDQTRGLENLVAQSGLHVPGGLLILNAWDRPTWLITNPASYPSRYYPNNKNEIVRGFASCANGSTFLSTTQDGLVASMNGGTTWETYITNGAAAGGECAVLSSTDWIWDAFENVGGPYFTNNGGSSWSPCTFNNRATVSGGGWGGPLSPLPQYLVYDAVSGSTIIYNDGSGSNPQGFYKSTSVSSCRFTYLANPRLDTQGTAIIETAPGESCNLFVGFSPYLHGGLPNNSTHLYKSTNCGRTWAGALPNVESVVAYGFGAAKPGGDGYPTLYCACWVNTGSGYAYGFWEADNINSNSPTWTQIGNGYPNDSYDGIVFITGDLQAYGKVYGGIGATGFFYGTH